MNKKIINSVFGFSVCLSFVVTVDAITSQGFQIVSNKIAEIMQPSFKKIYLKYASEIKWLEENYAADEVKGDALLAEMHNDCVEMSVAMAKCVCESQKKDKNLNPEEEQEQVLCKRELTQVLVNFIEQSLKMNAQIKSALHQELVAKKNNQNNKN